MLRQGQVNGYCSSGTLFRHFFFFVEFLSLS
jgi:hypothetical protein